MLVGIVVLSPLPSAVPATLAAARAASGGPWLPADPLWFLNGNMFIVAGAGMTLTSLLLVMHAVLLLYAVASFFFANYKHNGKQGCQRYRRLEVLEPIGSWWSMAL